MGKTIDLKAKDGFTLAAHRADPAGKPKGGLVVIQEIFGVNHHMRNVTDRFAAAGYAAVAPALFDRAKRGVDIGYDEAAIETGRNLRAEVKLDDTLLDLQADSDPFHPIEKMNELKDELGDRVSVAVIRDASHALLPEQPNAVVEAIAAWVRGL